MEWWREGYGDIKQTSINISFNLPPVPITNAGLQTVSSSKSSTDESLRPRDFESSTSADFPAFAPFEEFERDVVGSDDQPGDLEYPFVTPGIERLYASTKTILKNENKNEKKPKR